MAAAGAVTFFTGLGAIFASFASRTDVLRQRRHTRGQHRAREAAVGSAGSRPDLFRNTREARVSPSPKLPRKGHTGCSQAAILCAQQALGHLNPLRLPDLGLREGARTNAELRQRVGRLRGRRELACGKQLREERKVGTQPCSPWCLGEKARLGWEAASLLSTRGRCSALLPCGSTFGVVCASELGGMRGLQLGGQRQE